MTIIINNEGQAYKTTGLGATTGAIVVGSIVQGAALMPHQKFVAPRLMGKVVEQSKNIDTEIMQKGVQDAFEKSGLKQKGVELLDVREVASGDEIPEANKKLVQALEESIRKLLPKKYKNDKTIFEKIQPQLKNFTRMIETGDNAAFLMLVDKLAINTEKLGIAAFHEIGHAMNKHNSKLWNFVRLCRTPGILAASLIGITGIVKRKKVEGEEPKNNFDKVTTFIKNNSGKLVTLSLVPLIAEEYMATRNGEKLAKQVLTPKLFKKVKTSNRFAGLTYLSIATLSGIGTYAGSKVRDIMTKPKEL